MVFVSLEQLFSTALIIYAELRRPGAACSFVINVQTWEQHQSSLPILSQKVDFEKMPVHSFRFMQAMTPFQLQSLQSPKHSNIQTYDTHFSAVRH